MVSPSSKKRRRDDDGEVQRSPSSTSEASQNVLSAITERFVIPSSRVPTSLVSLPRKAVTKRFRLAEENPHEQSNTYYAHHNHNHAHAHDLSSTFSQSQQPQQSHFSHAHPDLNSAASSSSHQIRPSHTTRTNSAAVLSPCHICHRKPTRKSDLDSFADCMGCGGRTCFVCLRVCQGWLTTSNGGGSDEPTPETEELSTSFTMRDVDDEETTTTTMTTHGHGGQTAAETQQNAEQRQKKGEGGWNARSHRGVICSRCCVEQGSEGDVVCLGCLAEMKGA